jgi:sodium/hydrogen antiporter
VGRGPTNAAAVVWLAFVLFAWETLLARLAARNLTAPFVFMVAGLLIANPEWGSPVRTSRARRFTRWRRSRSPRWCSPTPPPCRWRRARQDLPLTSRLLAIGLPLTIVAGAAVAVLVFPSLPLALAGLIAAGLAPTDAALSASVIGEERLPAGPRGNGLLSLVGSARRHVPAEAIERL